MAGALEDDELGVFQDFGHTVDLVDGHGLVFRAPDDQRRDVLSGHLLIILGSFFRFEDGVDEARVGAGKVAFVLHGEREVPDELVLDRLVLVQELVCGAGQRGLRHDEFEDAFAEHRDRRQFHVDGRFEVVHARRGVEDDLLSDTGVHRAKRCQDGTTHGRAEEDALAVRHEPVDELLELHREVLRGVLRLHPLRKAAADEVIADDRVALFDETLENVVVEEVGRAVPVDEDDGPLGIRVLRVLRLQRRGALLHFIMGGPAAEVQELTGGLRPLLLREFLRLDLFHQLFELFFLHMPLPFRSAICFPNSVYHTGTAQNTLFAPAFH